MSSGILSEEVKIVKAEKALHAAMLSLLKKNSFRKITIKGICEEALISRATFYAHFIDKYDLLKQWMAEIWPKEFYYSDAYEKIEMGINSYINQNMVVVKNLLLDADNETFIVLFEFILSTINRSMRKDNSKNLDAKDIVLSNFYAGGLISYLLWQVNNRFPSDIPPMNKYLYDMMFELQNWQPK